MANKIWHELLEQQMSRRSFFKLGLAAAGAAVLPLESTLAAPAARTSFAAVKPSTADDLLLPRGYRYQVVAAWGDALGNNERFGFNNDYIGFFPIDGLEKGFDIRNPQGFYSRSMSSTEGMLTVNHEYPNPLFIHGNTSGAKSQEQIDAEKYSVGVSVFRVRRGANGQWSVVEDARNRRVSGLTPAMFTGPAAGSAAVFNATEAIGSVGNCAGGTTPWGTLLTCEENVDDYALPVEKLGYGWDASYVKEHQGWVTEIDPYNQTAAPRKHTAMGRFRHENVAVTVSKSGKVVAYMGDDKIDSCLYKFVSDGAYNPGNREANMALLESGKLYAADFSSGKWLLIDYDQAEALRTATKTDGTALFASQSDVLGDARAAALLVKATPIDRPEDIEIHPRTGQIYVALTNNSAHGNFHGQIVRLAESGNDGEATTFEWDLFAAGGPQNGFSSPDNLIFDPYGNLWMVTDISSNRAAKGIYKFQGNNAMFFFATEGPNAGKAVQFASGPVECEMTGPCWTPDGRTLFLSVQHPGEESSSMDKLSSTWPRRAGDTIPRPAVVAIGGFAGWR